MSGLGDGATANHKQSVYPPMWKSQCPTSELCDSLRHVHNNFQEAAELVKLICPDVRLHLHFYSLDPQANGNRVGLHRSNRRFEVTTHDCEVTLLARVKKVLNYGICCAVLKDVHCRK